MRDLGSAEVWQESLERSQARRVPRVQTGPKGARRRHWPLSLGTVCLVVTLLMVAVGVSLAGGGGRAAAYRHRAQADIVIGSHPAPVTAGMAAPSMRSCQPTAGFSGYVDPLRWAKVIPERIDQGVDYAGTGKVLAIGRGRITYVGTSGTGWPGAFIEYRLLSGPDAGCFVYYAEGVQPSTWLRVGRLIHRGEAVASIIPGWSTGIELGWGSGHSTGTYAERVGHWTPVDDAKDVASSAGRSFSSLIGDLGGPVGKVEQQRGGQG